MRRSMPILVLASLTAIALWAGCAKDTIDDPDGDAGSTADGAGDTVVSTGMTCVGCHTDKDLLKEVTDELHPEDPNAEEPEESGDG